jgi:uncharacterized membrane protein
LLRFYSVMLNVVMPNVVMLSVVAPSVTPSGFDEQLSALLVTYNLQILIV